MNNVKSQSPAYFRKNQIVKLTGLTLNRLDEIRRRRLIIGSISNDADDLRFSWNDLMLFAIFAYALKSGMSSQKTYAAFEKLKKQGVLNHVLEHDVILFTNKKIQFIKTKPRMNEYNGTAYSFINTINQKRPDNLLPILIIPKLNQELKMKVNESL